jgi:murein DD-endopeptidase MepM/ murein hydrolase activator NlpD
MFRIHGSSYLLFFLVNLILISIGSLHAQDVNLENKSESSDFIDMDETRDNSFNEFIDTIYRSDSLIINSEFGWDNQLINSGHFDSKNMMDTLYYHLTNRSSHEYFYPPFTNYVTCGFGYRRYLFHFGIDIKLEKGDSVKAAFDGVVRVMKYDRRGFGNVIVLRHEKGLETIYGHLSKPLVKINQQVKAGDLIGFGGNTGRSTGSHLHFETRYMGEPFDPSCFYNFTDHTSLRDTLVLSKSNFEYLVELRKEKFCVIRKGDTLGTIARLYHTSVSSLCRLNNITPKTILRVGRKLRYI